MIGTLDLSKREVTIVGGGIAGLLAAYTLDQKGFEVSLFETQPRLGGLIQTEDTPFGISESAAHSFLATPPVRRLCQDLGVDLIPVNPESRARFVMREGKMRRFPLSPVEILGILKRAVFLRGAIQEKGDFKQSSSGSVTVADWAERYLGPAALQYLISPMVQGIYGTSPAELELEAAFPAFQVLPGKTLLETQLAHLKEKRKTRQGKLDKSRKTVMMTPRGGVGELIHALEEKLKNRLGTRLHLDRPIGELPRSGNVILCTPAFVSAKLLENDDSILAEALCEIQYTSLVSITAFIRKQDLLKVPNGVGVLMPPGEKNKCLGILFNSSSFENRVTQKFEDEWISVSAILGGTRNPEAMDLPDQALLEWVQEDLHSLFGFKGNLETVKIWRQKNAVPRYNRDLQRVWKIARAGWCSQPGRVLFGNYTGAVSIRGMIESVSLWDGIE